MQEMFDGYFHESNKDNNVSMVNKHSSQGKPSSRTVLKKKSVKMKSLNSSSYGIGGHGLDNRDSLRQLERDSHR